MDKFFNVKNTLIFKCEKLAQRLHCVCRLRLFEVSSVVMGIFCNSVLESLIRYEMTAWFWLAYSKFRV